MTSHKTQDSLHPVNDTIDCNLHMPLPFVYTSLCEQAIKVLIVPAVLTLNPRPWYSKLITCVPKMRSVGQGIQNLHSRQTETQTHDVKHIIAYMWTVTICTSANRLSLDSNCCLTSTKSNVATTLVTGQPITMDLSGARTTSDTSSTHVASHIELMLTRFFSRRCCDLTSGGHRSVQC